MPAHHDRLADTQLLISYRGSPLVTGAEGFAETRLRPGDRAPDVVGLRREKVGFPLDFSMCSEAPSTFC
jgi:hypothetical protein